MSKIKLQIKNRWTGSIIFEYEKENNTIWETVKEYIRQECEEKGKTRADLTDADLTRANLTDADLTDANLTRADLTRANLTRANLTDANLTDADLTDANLTRANLTRANLTRANLTRANLTDANLTPANLRNFKNDLWRVLLTNKHEIGFLKQSLIDGKISGTAYDGECACLKGTIRKAKACEWKDSGLVQNVNEPCETWFLQIKEGQTPENSKVVKLTLEWIEEFELLLNSK